MRQLKASLLASTLLLPCIPAKIHHLFVGNLAAPFSLYALSFDTTTLNLSLTKNITAGGTHPWLTLSHDKKNVYGASFSTPEIFSYSVTNNGSDLHLDSVVRADCGVNDTSAHIVAMQHPPYTAYSSTWPGKPACGNVYSALPNGTLTANVQSLNYTNSSGIHGLALHPSERTLYAADLSGNAIWTHTLDDDGIVTDTKLLNTSSVGEHPRHVAVHPNGTWLYTVFEASNMISAFPLNAQTSALSLPSTRYSLLPNGPLAIPIAESAPALNESFWSAEITLSPSSAILWATARPKANTTDLGYISAFQLSASGEIEKRLFIVPTTTAGGIADSVSVAPGTDEFVALTDLKSDGRGKRWGAGYVEIWRVKGLNGSASGSIGEEIGAEAVARVDIDDGGCCANVIWYD